MLRKSLLVALVLAVGVVMTGCASLDLGPTLNNQKLTSADEQPVAHVNGSNWGIYLLPIIPILTGDTDNPGTGITFMDDSVSVDRVVGMVTKKSGELGATKTTDLTSSTFSLWLAPTLVLWYKSCEASGNAIK